MIDCMQQNDQGRSHSTASSRLLYARSVFTKSVMVSVAVSKVRIFLRQA